MANTNTTSSGIGLPGLLTLIFITLKLCHVIDWSWWWVLAPIWIAAGLVVFFLSLYAIGVYLTRPKTTEEKISAACDEIARRLRK